VSAVTIALEAPALPTYDLSPGETASILRLLGSPAAGALAQERPRPVTRRLPERLLDFLDEFPLTEPAGGIIIRGFPVNDAEIGPTPGHWRDAAELVRLFSSTTTWRCTAGARSKLATTAAIAGSSGSA